MDARGTRALVDCRPHRCLDLLRLVYSAIQVVLGSGDLSQRLSDRQKAELRRESINPPTFARVREYFLGRGALDSSWTPQQGDHETEKSERRT